MINSELVLIADDDEECLRFCCDLVRQDGFQVHEARNGVQATLRQVEADLKLARQELAIQRSAAAEG